MIKIGQYHNIPSLQIKIIPGVGKNQIIITKDEIKVKISAPPEKGKANLELIKFLSAQLGLPKSKITIAQGETQRTKLVVFDCTEEFLHHQISLLNS